MMSREKKRSSPAAHVQEKLESLYGIEIPGRVDDFLIGTEIAQKYFLRKNSGKVPPELLFVREGAGQSFEVALYVDPKVLTQLSSAGPSRSGGGVSLSNLCILIEGVSHFNYLVWKGARGIPVTQLELELQAEIDKFLFLFLTGSSRRENRDPHQLLDFLFDRFSLRNRLSPEERERYLTASSLASHYCFDLQKRYFSRPDRRDWITREARNFYALSQHDKISRILH